MQIHVIAADGSVEAIYDHPASHIDAIVRVAPHQDTISGARVHVWDEDTEEGVTTHNDEVSGSEVGFAELVGPELTEE